MRKNVINRRIEFGYTRAALAEKLDVSEIHVRKIEEGSRNPSITLMLKFENVLNMSMRELFEDIFLNKNDTKRINKLA